MKCIVLAAAVVAVLCVGVKAEEGEGWFGGEEGGDRCVCVAPSGSGRRSRPGTCGSNTGTTAVQIGCPGTNQYKNCAGTTCSVVNCTTGQVWSYKAKACAACASDEHVRADLLVCVCNQGVKKNRTTGLCDIPCPTGSTILLDSCKCPTTAPLIHHKSDGTTECRACPTGSTQRGGSCVCNKATPAMYWQESSWSCVACPGTVQNVTYNVWHYSVTVEICNCTGANQIFDLEGVQCYTCPAADPAKRNHCTCPIRDQIFNMVAGTCKCDGGDVFNAATNSCVMVPRTTSTAAPTATLAAGGNQPPNNP